MGVDAAEFQVLGTGLSDKLTKTIINVVLSGGLAFTSYVIDNHLTVRDPESSVDWASTWHGGKAPHCRPNLGYALGKATHLRDATRTLAASMSQPASRTVYDFRPSPPQSELSIGWVLGIAMCAIIMTIAASFLCQSDHLRFHKPASSSLVSPCGRSPASHASVPAQRVASSSRSRGSGGGQTPPRQSNDPTTPLVKVEPQELPLQYTTSDRGGPPPPPPSSSAATRPWDHSGWKFIILVLVLVACFILGLVALVYKLVPSKFRYWLRAHFGRSLPDNVDTPAAVFAPTESTRHSKSHSTPPNCSNIIPLSSRSPVATRLHPSPSVQPFKFDSPQRQINIVKTLNVFRDRVYAPLVGTVGVFLASLSLVYLLARHRFDHPRFSGYDMHKTELNFLVDNSVSEGEVAAVDATIIPDKLELLVDNVEVEVSEAAENAVTDPKAYIADDFDVAGDTAEDTLEMADQIDAATEVETAEDATPAISIAGTDDLSGQVVETIDQIDVVPKVKMGDEQDGNKACIATDFDLVDESVEVIDPLDAVEETKIIYSHPITSNIEDKGRVEDAIIVEATSPTHSNIVPILDTAQGNESNDIEIPRDFNTSIILEAATIEEAPVVSSLLTILEEEPVFGCEIIIPSDTVVIPHETGIVGDEEVDYIHESLGHCESHTELEQAPQQLLPLRQQELIPIRNHRQETQHIARYVNHTSPSGPKTWGRSPMNANLTSLNPDSRPFVPLSQRPPSHPQSRGMVQDPMHIYQATGVPTCYPQPQPGFQGTASQNYGMSRYQASTQARSFHAGNFTRGASHPDQYANSSGAYQDNRGLFQRPQPMAPSHPNHTFLPSTSGRSMGGFLPSRAHEMQPLAAVPTHGYNSVSSSSSYGGTLYVARQMTEQQRFGAHYASSSFSPNYNVNVYPGMAPSASMVPRPSFNPYNHTSISTLPETQTSFYGGYTRSVSAPLAHNNGSVPHWASLAQQNYTPGQVFQGHDGRPQGPSQGLWPVNSQNTRIQPAPVVRRGEGSIFPLTGHASTSYHPIDDLFPQAGQPGRSSTDSHWAPTGGSGSSSMASSQNAGAITIAIGRSSIKADSEGSGEQTKSAIKRTNRRARLERLMLQAARRRPQGTIVEVEDEKTTEAGPTEASIALLLSDTTAASSDLVQQPFLDSAWHLAASYHPAPASASLQDVAQPPNSPRVAAPSPINNVHSRHPHLDLHPQAVPNRQSTSRGRRLGATQSWNDIQDEDRRQER